MIDSHGSGTRHRTRWLWKSFVTSGLGLCILLVCLLLIPLPTMLFNIVSDDAFVIVLIGSEKKHSDPWFDYNRQVRKLGSREHTLTCYDFGSNGVYVTSLPDMPYILEAIQSDRIPQLERSVVMVFLSDEIKTNKLDMKEVEEAFMKSLNNGDDHWKVTVALALRQMNSAKAREILESVADNPQAMPPEARERAGHELTAHYGEKPASGHE